MPDFYRALGDTTRRHILRLLKKSDRTQKELVEAFEISQPAIKKHLKILIDEKLVTVQRQGKYRVYRLNSHMLSAAYEEMLQDIGDLLDDKLERLKDYVEKGED